MLLHESLRKIAAQFPDKKAVIYDSRSISYRELDRDSDAVAEFLAKARLEKGARAGILMDNCIENVILFFAIVKVGGIEVGLSSRTTRKSILYSLNNSSVKILFVKGIEKKMLKEILEGVASLEYAVLFDDVLLDSSSYSNKRILLYSNIIKDNLRDDNLLSSEENDICMIQYTSGSSGMPKGVMLTHRNFIAATQSRIRYFDIDRNQIYLLPVPLAHSCGKSTLIDCVYNGNTIIFVPGNFSPTDFLEAVIDNGVTSIIGPPFIFNFLLKANQVSSANKKLQNNLKHLEIGLSYVPESLVYELRKAFPHVSIAIRYGLTENAGAASLNVFKPQDPLEKINSCGRGMDITTILIVGENKEEMPQGRIGELVLRGENVMSGYWGQGSNSFGNLGFYTGDLGKKDEDGFIYIVGRKTEMIKSRGERISPKEIEEILLNSSLVKEAAAIGVKDDLLGQKIKVIIVPSVSDISEADINKFCRLNMPSFMVPEIIEFRDFLPKTPSGKIDKMSLN